MLKKIVTTGFCWLWVAVLVIVVDRFSKTWVMQHLSLGEPFGLVSFFNLTLAYNTGAAFSFLHNASGWQNILLGGLAFIVSIIILVNLAKHSVREWWLNIALCLVLGGALGNAWDRMLYSHVIDFFDFHLGDWHFAIFNVADSAICVGAFMLFCYWIQQSSKKK